MITEYSCRRTVPGNAARAWLALGLMFAAAQGVQAQQQLTLLGPAPQLQPGEEPKVRAYPYSPGTKAVSFNPMVRTQVANAYINTYLPQGNVAVAWTGNLAGCVAGVTATQYRQATIDRVNYYRAHAGLPGNITLFGGSQATNTQQAALMFSANNALSHNPPASWNCYTAGGATGAGGSNIGISWGSGAAAGPNVVNMYVDDPGNGNEMVGHRRWILFPPQAQMDSGTVPHSGPQAAANALWVFGPMGSRPATPNGVAWPPRGYVPWQVLPSTSNRWSFSWPNANFSGASVSMTRNGAALGAPTYEPIANGYGDNTLVWKPQGVTYTQPASDVTYRVTINGISGGGAPASITYDVIVIDPYTGGGTTPNQAPSISAPAMLPVFLSGTAPISGVRFADPDVGNTVMRVTLTPPAGVTLSGNSQGGVTVTTSGNTRRFDGTLTALNTYFAAGTARMAGAAFIGPANLTIAITDNHATDPKTTSTTVQLRGGFLFANGFE